VCFEAALTSRGSLISEHVVRVYVTYVISSSDCFTCQYLLVRVPGLPSYNSVTREPFLFPDSLHDVLVLGDLHSALHVGVERWRKLEVERLI